MKADSSDRNGKLSLKVGDWVEILSKEEILETLDSNGQLDGMPFMPEMFAFCGKRFQVHKSAHKTCDTVFPIRGRRVERTIHLETRCDGQAHGGCQAACLLFWKEAWLKPISGNSTNDIPIQIQPHSGNVTARPATRYTEADLWAATQVSDQDAEGPAYVCQATRLPYATTDLSPWDVSQYVEDYKSGNVGLGRMFSGLIYSAYYKVSCSRLRLGPVMEWFYDKFHPLWRGTQFPRKRGTVPEGQPTPLVNLNLQPGELVRVKSHDEILRTVGTNNKNRGMYWDAEMVPYCGKTFRVLKRVTKIVNEKTGRMQEMKNPCIILDSVACQARYSDCRMFCPRGIYPYWREIWLERVAPTNSSHLEVEDLSAQEHPAAVALQVK